MRCRALAAALKENGAECLMVGPDTSFQVPTDNNLFVDWVHIPQWAGEKNDAVNFLDLAKRYDCCAAVLDDYRVAIVYQSAMRSSGLKWAQFDHRMEGPLLADWIINAAPGVSAEDYHGVTERAEQQVLCGPRYAIIRPDLVKCASGRRSEPSRQRKILVMFGGGDDRGAIEFTLDALYSQFTNVGFTVVIGGAHPTKAELAKRLLCDYGERLEVLVQPNNLGEVYHNSTLAVVGGGTTTFELALYGVPMVIMTIADNQENQARGWEKIGCAVYLGQHDLVRLGEIVDAVKYVLCDDEKRQAMTHSARSTIDGLGAMRCAKAILGYEF
jgi:UDP-2,4-diacetamido-2,4,6-trideoxy-beta-L-altropyranose hydrolase